MCRQGYERIGGSGRTRRAEREMNFEAKSSENANKSVTLIMKVRIMFFIRHLEKNTQLETRRTVGGDRLEFETHT